MNFRVIQCNVNHCWAAQDLLDQNMIELKAGICAIAEPVRIPSSLRWFGSGDGRAAIRWDPEILHRVCTLTKRGQQYVTVKCGDVYITSCYVSPNVDIYRFQDFLDELSDTIRDLSGKMIVCGDFNAKSVLWGSPDTNIRGEYVEEWAAAHDLRIANIGNSPTCVRSQGESIVDLTWVTPEAVELVENWSVRNDVETLSDHVYITFSVGSRLRRGGSNGPIRRWNLKKLDKPAFDLSLCWTCYNDPNEDGNLSATDYARWIDKTMEEACNASAPKIGRKQPKRVTYWWDDNIAALRSDSIKARRLWRNRGRNGSHSNALNKLKEDYRLKKKKFRKAIRITKAKVWRSLISTIDEDVWGLPYRLVMSRLRCSSPSYSEMIEPIWIFWTNCWMDCFLRGQTKMPLPIGRIGVGAKSGRSPLVKFSNL